MVNDSPKQCSMSQLVYNTGDLEGIQTIKEDNGKKWNGKAQVRDTMQTREKQQELWKVGKEV